MADYSRIVEPLGKYTMKKKLGIPETPDAGREPVAASQPAERGIKVWIVIVVPSYGARYTDSIWVQKSAAFSRKADLQDYWRVNGEDFGGHLAFVLAGRIEDAELVKRNDPAADDTARMVL